MWQLKISQINYYLCQLILFRNELFFYKQQQSTRLKHK
jgi:hypothetical protein